MTREIFIEHIRQRVEESILRCEVAIGRPLPRTLHFQWFSPKRRVVTDGIYEEICQLVFVAPDQIYPCVDIGPMNEDSGILLIGGFRAGYAPRPFGKNWAGDDGPFIIMRGGEFAHKQHANH